MGKVLNFDLFMQEQRHETMDVIVMGDTYTVPMEVPAIVPVMMARAEETINPMEYTRIIMRTADLFFGKEAVDTMCKKGMGAKNLAALIEKIFNEINGGGDADDEVQELSDDDGYVQTNSGKRAKK